MKTPTINEQQRRQHILDAFIVHVIEKGFHRASMSSIAKTAGLSVGQIYRYFESKEDIIHALVERKTEEYLSLMEDFLDKKDWLARHFEQVETQDFYNQRILHIEIRAEATRNPKVAKIQYDAELRLNAHAVNIVKQRYHLEDEIDIAARVEFLVSLTEGMLSRSQCLQRPFSIQAHALYQRIFDELFPNHNRS